MPSPPSLRVGTVPYLVGRPLDTGLEGEPGIELVREVPARLVAELRSGRLDVALVSSIELFRRPGYRYLDGLGVSGRGFVSSVQLFLRKPLEKLGSVALDPSSRAAAALLRVLLAEREAGAPDFLEVPAGEDPRAAAADAWLRIGDTALREYLEAGEHDVYNPAAEWTRRTGLPFVFAPWIIRPGVDLTPHFAAFARARARGSRILTDLSREAAERWTLPQRACEHYFCEEVDYEPGERMQPALLAFRDAAAGLGLCQADLAPEPVPLRAGHTA